MTRKGSGRRSRNESYDCSRTRRVCRRDRQWWPFRRRAANTASKHDTYTNGHKRKREKLGLQVWTRSFSGLTRYVMCIIIIVDCILQGRRLVHVPYGLAVGHQPRGPAQSNRQGQGGRAERLTCYLLTVAQESHGLYTFGIGVDGEQRQTASGSGRREPQGFLH